MNIMRRKYEYSIGEESAGTEWTQAYVQELHLLERVAYSWEMHLLV